MVVWLPLLGVSPAGAAPFSSPLHGFSLTLPDEFELVRVEDPRVALVARPRGGGFPTLTVTVEAGPFRNEPFEPGKRGERLLESLQGVGLLDARLIEVKPRLPGGRPAVEARFEYSQTGRSVNSRVVELTVPERRLTFTWIEIPEDSPRTAVSFDTVIDSLAVDSAEPPPGGGAAPHPNDIGPIYAETDMNRFPVEPWNTASNLVFLALLVVFGRRTRLDRRRYPFLVPGLFVLAIGFVGGTVYHATRSHNLWLFLDFLPILLLTGAASIYFWLAVVKSRALAVGLCLSLLLSGRLVRVALELPKNLGITVSYLGAALAILVPAAIHANGVGRKHRRWLVWSAILFGVALTCRFLDRGAGVMLLPMGTHFLWHIFGGLSVGALLHYIAGIEEDAAALKR